MLTEVPEMFGAETLLMERAANEEVFHKVVDFLRVISCSIISLSTKTLLLVIKQAALLPWRTSHLDVLKKRVPPL